MFRKKNLIETINKNETCCLTGHRPKYLPWGYDEKNEKCIQFKSDLKNILEETINKGYNIFLTGMAEGFDMIATEILIKLRKKYAIKIIAIIPCKGQEKKWSLSQQKRYRTILKKCNELCVLNNTYTLTCMNERNKFMIENSSLVISCCTKKPSGTNNTLKLAKNSGNKIINLNLSECK